MICRCLCIGFGSVLIVGGIRLEKNFVFWELLKISRCNVLLVFGG